MIPLKDAQSLILDRTLAIREVEDIPLHLANGRTLAIDLIAPFPQPPFTNSGMDGFALSSERTESASPESPLRFPVKGYQFAGSHPGNPDRESAAEIATGAPLPAGKDAVITKEEAQTEGGYLIIRRPVSKGENVRWQGEDVAAGARLLSTG
ncbi:MAG: molybdopterin molybdenumtransferase MoeA, partial [Deltaproteobacteria bacterium]|nr:molybdopterin molybdenumtransferase MoeA [Deltaproteobacteria bacterium]